MKGNNQNTDFSMFRYFKGEKQNPFDHENQNAAHMFWFYESVFEEQFNSNESSEWYSFFNSHDLGGNFMKLITEEDYERPTEIKKKPVFDLWIDYLFNFKLYPEYGGENTTKTLYYNSAVYKPN
jgi:hypothetical protein